MHSADTSDPFELICNNAMAALFIMDEHNCCIYMNPAATELTGYTLDEMRGRPLHQMLHHRRPDGTSYPAEACPIVAGLEHGSRVRGEEVFVHKDGRFYDIAFASSLLRKDGRITGSVLEVRDITERKRNERSLQVVKEQLEARVAEQSESLDRNRAQLARQAKFLDTVLDSLQGQIFVWDRAGRFVYVNRSLERLWDRPREQLVGRTAAELGYPADLVEQFERQMAQVINTSAAVTGEYALTSPSGVFGYFDTVFSPVLDDNGDVSLIAGVARDSTDRWRLEEALRQANEQLEKTVDERTRNLVESEARYRSLFETIGQGFCVFEMLFDRDGRPCDYLWLETNPAFERHTGLRDAVGRTAREMVPGLEQHWIDTYGRVALTGETERFVASSDAMGRWFEVEAFRAGPTASRRVALLFTDVTERKHAEQALRDANDKLKEGDRRKDEFLAMLAHELRNPLAAVRNAVTLLERHGSDVPNQYVGLLDRQVTNLNGIVDDLLDVSRVTGGLVTLNREPVDVATAVEHALESVQPLIDERRHEVSVTMPGSRLRTLGDPLRIEQILVNLLNNAAKYTDPGGRIEVAVTRTGDFAELRVCDSGIGMTPDVLSRIFDLFGQAERGLARSHGGLGIGLTIVRSLVQLHGGRIAAHSEGLGKGSQFVVSLPLAASPPEVSPEPHAAERDTARSRRILVVDDNEDIAETLAMLLEGAGHRVTVAHDGPSALARADESDPELVLLDIGLPGMDGYEVASRLRQQPQTAATTLVALTGYGQPEDRDRAMRAGFNQHFVKPVDIVALEQYLDSV